MYVCDRGNNRIQVFYADGTGYQWIESKGGYPSTVAGSFDAPSALDLDSQWAIVAEPGNYRVQVLQLAPHRKLSYGGTTSYHALEPSAYYASVTGIAPMVQWYKSPNTLITNTSSLNIPRLSTHNIGTYYGKVLAGCRVYTTPTFQIQVHRLPQTVLGFDFPDTVYLSQGHILLPQLRILGHSVAMYASSDNSIAYWSWSANAHPETIKLSKRGQATISIGNLGNIYYLPITRAKDLVIMETQTITATALPTVSFSGSAVTIDIDFRSSALEPVTVVGTSTPAHIYAYDNGKLTISGVGSITLTGYQARGDYLLAAKPYGLVIEVVTVSSITKSTQTVVGYHLPVATITGQQVFSHAFNYTATSGLEVRYAYATDNYSVVTLASNVLSVSGPCTVTISGYQPGNALYASAEPFRTVVQVVSTRSDSVINDLPSSSHPYLTLYPNPSSGDQWVTLDGIQDTTTVQIFNSGGDPIPFLRVRNTFSIQAPQGIYWVKTTQPNALLKWVKQD